MRTFWITAVLTMLASLAGAWLTQTFVSGRIALWGAWLGLQRSYNAGIAFGLRLPAVVQEMLIAAALIGITVMALRSARTRQNATGFGLIVGGGVANVLDRIPDGLVTDVFQVGSFPIFNVADSCITVGVMLLLWETVVSKKRGERRNG